MVLRGTVGDEEASFASKSRQEWRLGVNERD
jgi:hypothetical protein